MNFSIANNSILANLLTTCFKLWLNQSHHLPLFSQDTVQGGQNQTEGNETHINTGKTWFLLKISPFSIAEIKLLHTNNPRILAQFPSQLIGTNIDCVNKLGPILQHDIGKASGRSTNINRGCSLH